MLFIFRRLISLRSGITAVLAALACALAHAAPAVVLHDGAGVVDAWSAATLLSDPTLSLGIDAARARAHEFQPLSGPNGNLGVRRDAVWLRIVPLVPRGGDGHWLLELDYPVLNHIDVYLFTDGRLAHTASLGNARPFAARALPSCTPAVALELAPEHRHEVFVRIATKSSAVAPISFVKPAAFHARESSRQMLQGLMGGVGLCLLAYSLAQWATVRDRMFAYYAVTIAASTMFFFVHFGFASQYLWPASPWLAMNTAPLTLLFGLTGLSPLISRVLKVGEWSRKAALTLNAMTFAAIAVIAAFLLGTIDYRLLHLSTTILGPLPMMIAVAASVVRWRRGDRAAPYILVGWGAYIIGMLVMVALVRGWVGATFWTQHSFQFATMFEMLMWMLVLGVRLDEMREVAQRAHLERDALRSMAYTDALTGLPNRRGLHEALRAELVKCRSDRMVAVYLLDLDGFKGVNDRLGHDAGDELLLQVAKRLQSLLRSSDVVARLGGDEFVIVAGGLPGDVEAQSLGRKLLEGFRLPFDVARQSCPIGLTISYALSPQHGHDAVSLMKCADAAMYAGKEAGRNCLRRSSEPAVLAAA